MDLDEIIVLLKNSILENKYYEKKDFFIENLNKFPISQEVVNKILKIFENNPNFNFGNPGYLVHFLERDSTGIYENSLIESIKNIPTAHTLFMFNRVINSSDEQKKIIYISVLESLKTNFKSNQEILDTINDFLNFQTRNLKTNDCFEYFNLELVKKVSTKKELLHIKTLLGINKSLSELLKDYEHLPLILVENITKYQANHLIEEKLKNYKDLLSIKSVK